MDGPQLDDGTTDHTTRNAILFNKEFRVGYFKGARNSFRWMLDNPCYSHGLDTAAAWAKGDAWDKLRSGL